MTQDGDTEVKQPHILASEGDINQTVLVPGDPDRVDRIAERLEDVEVVSHNREYRLVNGVYEGEPVTVCSTGVGSPSAAVAVEELVNIGAETFIRPGTTGGLQEDVTTGDVVIPTASAKYEGTTKRYEDVEYPAVPSLDVTNSLVDAADEGGHEVHVGSVVTDDAFYAEDEPASDWEEAGMLSVEMEASALFTLARRRGVKAGAVLAVDGNLVAGEQKGETEDDEELPEEARAGVGRVIEIALEAAKRV